MTTTSPAAPDEAPRFRQGAGRLCLDFIRTLRHMGTADEVEELPDAEAVAAWVRQCGPCEVDASVSADAAQAKDAVALREAIRELIDVSIGPEGLAGSASAARKRINRMAGAAVPAPTLDETGRLRWHADDPIAATMSLLARDALDLVTSEAITRVRECADPDCCAMFSDSSRPGSRKWCSMGSCGNRAKKNTLRAKTAPH